MASGATISLHTSYLPTRAGYLPKATDLSGPAVNIMPTDAGFQRSFDYVIMTVLGGKGSITGVMGAAGHGFRLKSTLAAA